MSNTEYDVQVRASNSAGVGSWSTTVKGTTSALPAPDLVVDTPEVSESAPTAGASFTLDATVRNQGSGDASSTTLRYYQSTDSTITTGDTSLGTDSVSSLNASATSAESISVTAPSTAGTYYYGACVDSVTGEFDTTNNCSTAIAIAVGTALAPDLMVETPTVSTSAPTAGTSFTLNATVHNQGTAESSSTTLRYYQSIDSTITSADTPLGTDFVPRLDASATSAESISITAPSTPGSYYYGACVDSVTDESDATNNCSGAVTVTVGAKPAPPTNVRYRHDGSTITVSWTPSEEATHYKVYYDDFFGSSCRLSFGRPFLCEELSGNVVGSSYTHSNPDDDRNYYWVIACNDAGCSDIDSANPATLDGAAPAPDLVVDSPTVSESTPAAGDRFTLNATVRNQGNGESGSTTLRYYRSPDSTISSADSSMGTDFVSRLNASATSDEFISLTAPPTAGTYYYGACVDSVTDESDTTNNCSGTVTVTVGAAPVSDLVVDTPTVSTSTPTAGASFTLNATVRNQGSGSSASTTLRYYRSTDSAITTADTSVGTDSVSRLNASASSSESISVTAPSTPGTYYYGACVDSVTDESDTANNCSIAVAIALGTAPAPDLVVDTPTVSPSAPAIGASFTLSVTVRNQGTAESGSTTLRYYRSTDSTITSADISLGTDSVSSLNASATSAESISITAPSTAGDFYYGVCVDSVADESDDTNNCSGAIIVAVGRARTPDLAVGNLNLGGSVPTISKSFIINAVVTNEGNADAPATTLRFYLSSDSTISSSDTEVGSASVMSMSPRGGPNEGIVRSTRPTAPSTAGVYYYGACVDSVTGESDISNNCSQALTVKVVSGPARDLVVGTVAVSDSSPVAGAQFTLSTWVRNNGSGTTSSTTLRYYRSTDSTISDSDTELGTDSVSGLSSLDKENESIDLTSPSAPGTYYYGACVDKVLGELDATNNCSDSVTVTVGAASGPDLVVDTPTVSDSAPTPGASFTLNATVRNQGDGSSGSTTLRYYQVQ